MSMYAIHHSYYMDKLGLQWQTLFNDVLDRATADPDVPPGVGRPPPAPPIAAAGDRMAL